MLNLFDYDFGVRLIKPDPNIYYRTVFLQRILQRAPLGASFQQPDKLNLNNKMRPGANCTGP